MGAGLIAAVASSAASSPNGPNIDLSIPPEAGAAVAVFVVLLAGIIAWQMSNGLTFTWWISGPDLFGSFPKAIGSGPSIRHPLITQPTAASHAVETAS